MDKEEDDLVLLIVTITMVVLAIIMNGLYLSIAWEWFVVPLGVPAITKAHALGLMFLCKIPGYGTRASLYRSRKQKLTPGEEFRDDFECWMVLPTFTMVIAHICHLFM